MSDSKTLSDLLSESSTTLTEEFLIRPDITGSITTRATPEREKLFVPLLTSVSLNSKWLDDKLAAFLETYGDVPASEGSRNLTAYLPTSQVNHVVKKRTSWSNERSFVHAFRPLLELAISCVDDICAQGSDPPVIDIDDQIGRWAIPDIACYSDLDTTTRHKCFHLLVELKTLDVLNKDVIEQIVKYARPGGAWSLPGGFSDPVSHGLSPKEVTESTYKLAKSVICQPYGQMVAKTCVEDVRTDVTTSVSSTNQDSVSTSMPFSASPPVSTPIVTEASKASTTATTPEPLTVAISPLYAVLSNYNQTYIIMRSTGKAPTEIILAGPYPPGLVIPRLAVLIHEQVLANRSKKLQPLDFSSKEGLKALGQTVFDAWWRADENEEDVDDAEDADGGDDGDEIYKTEDGSNSSPDEAVSKKLKRKRDSDSQGDGDKGGGGSSGGGGSGKGGNGGITQGGKGGAEQKRGKSRKNDGAIGRGRVRGGRVAKRANEVWGPGVHFPSITYDYDIRGSNGAKFIFSNRAMSLTKWKYPRRHSSVLLPPSPLSSGLHHFPTIPHIRIMARLEEGVSGETFFAVSKHTPLVWKEIPLDDDHIGYAKKEVSMYEGPLAALQGTMVPHFYGAFHNEKENCVVLLMQYVGDNLGSDWESVPPELRERAEDLHARLRATGVEHGDWAPRNVCVLEGEMRVIDFSHAWPVM